MQRSYQGFIYIWWSHLIALGAKSQWMKVSNSWWQGRMLTPLASKRNGQVSGPFSQIHSCPFWPVKAPRIRLASGADWFLGWHFRCCCETLCTDWVSRAARSSHWKFKKQANQKIRNEFFTLRDSSWKINNGFIFFSFKNKCTRKKKGWDGEDWYFQHCIICPSHFHETGKLKQLCSILKLD